MKKSFLLLGLVALFIGSKANASESGGMAIGVKGGTLGAGVEINYPINSKLTVGFGLNKYSATTTDTADGINYDVDVDLHTIAILANFHPFNGSFRFTAGAMVNSNELSMTAGSSATYDVGGIIYTAAEVGILKAAVNFKKIAPYLGIGFGHSAGSGLGFTLDIGVLMQGEPNVDLTSTGGTLSSDAGFQASLAIEESNAEDDIEGFTLYPVASAGINYRF